MEMISLIYSIIWYYALYFVIIKLYNFFYMIYKHFFRKGYNLKERYGSKSWVLVTGATDGIGKGFCIEFAKLGFNIILVSRALEKLNKTADELRNSYNVNTHIVQFDFSEKMEESDYISSFGDLSKKYDISVIVNNVGYAEIVSYRTCKGKYIQDMVNVNVVPQAAISNIFVNSLIQRSKRTNQKSAIINLSSFLSNLQVEKLFLYNAGKTFNHLHSKLLNHELKSYNIDCLSVKPLWVATPLTRKKADNLIVITSEACCKAVLKHLGHDSETTGDIRHEIQEKIYLSIPNFIRNRFGKNSEV